MAAEISEQVKYYSKRLASLNAAKRKQAEDEICAMGDEGRDLLVEIMRRGEAQPFNPLTYGCLCGIATTIGCLIFFVIARNRLGSITSVVGNFFGVSVLAFLGSLWTRFMKSNAALLLATHFRDEAIIAPMCEALRYRDPATRKAASGALIDLLPRLQEDNRVELTSLQRTNLHRALHSQNRALVLAVLQGLRFLARSSVLPPVERLANGLGLAATDSNIRAEATLLLLLLQEREARAHSQATLLRASTTPVPSSSVLLRPAGNGEIEETVLLRAAGEGSGK